MSFDGEVLVPGEDLIMPTVETSRTLKHALVVFRDDCFADIHGDGPLGAAFRARTDQVLKRVRGRLSALGVDALVEAPSEGSSVGTVDVMVTPEAIDALENDPEVEVVVVD